MAKQTPEDFFRKRKLFNSSLAELELDKNYPCARISRDDINTAMDYCQENFNDEWIWSSPIHTETSKIWFLHHEDALLFKLRFNTV